MRFKVLVVLCSLGSVIKAQGVSGFYIEPLINVKTHTFYKKDLPAPLRTSYFEISALSRITPIGCALGANVGYEFKNHDRIQVGFLPDEVLTGFKFSHLYLIPGASNPSYRFFSGSGFGGNTIANFSFLYKRNIFAFNRQYGGFLRVNLNLGVSYFYKPKYGLKDKGFSKQGFIAPDSSQVTYTTTHMVIRQPFLSSWKLNTGIDFTFGKNNAEWFALNISFLTNFETLSAHSLNLAEITVAKNGSKTTYFYYVYGRGNGFYFTLSKRIYPVRWANKVKIKRAKKFQEMQSKRKAD